MKRRQDAYRYEVEDDRFYRVSDGESNANLLLTCCFHIGYSCNIQCPYCFSPFASKKLVRVDFREIASFIGEQQLQRVVISGGEPFLYERELLSAVEALKDLGTSVLISTNGLLLSKSINRYESILRKVDWVDISLPAATPSTYQIVRQYDGFDEVITAVKKLQDFGKRVRLSFSLCDSNERELYQFLELVASLGVENVRIGNMYLPDQSKTNSLPSTDFLLNEAPHIRQVYLPLDQEAFTHYCEGYLVIRYDGKLFKCSALDSSMIGSIVDFCDKDAIEEMAIHQAFLFGQGD